MILFPFRYKLGLAIGLLSVLVSGSTLFYFYKQIQSTVWTQMSLRLKDVGRTGASFITDKDRDDIKKIVQIFKDRGAVQMEELPTGPGEYSYPLSDEETEAIHETEEFQNLVQILRKVKYGTRMGLPKTDWIGQEVSDPEKPILLRYAYLHTIIYADDGRKVVQVIADSDFREFDYNGDGEIDESEEATGSGTLFDITDFPAMHRAFQGEVTADDEYTADTFGIFLSAYIPIIDQDGKVLAVMGLDMRADNEYNMLNQVFYLYLGLVAVSAIFSIAVAVFVAGFLTRPLTILRNGAEIVKTRNFANRIHIRTRDEMELVASAFNDMVTEIANYSDSLEKQNEAFFRFVPNQFLQILGKSSAIEIAMGDSNQIRMTILFCDIRSFTTISESMSPEENLQFLNEYMQRMEPAIKGVGGFVDKFVGDGIMALFIDTEDRSSTENAIEASLTMRRELERYNGERIDSGKMRIDMGIGLATGDVILGTVGSSNRLDTTVIGSTVNIASRIESLTSLYRLPVLVSGDSYTNIPDENRKNIRYVDRITVKGQTLAMDLYEVYGYRSKEEIQKIELSSVYMDEGIGFYQKGQFDLAMEKFQEAKVLAPFDSLPRIYIGRCKKYIHLPPEEWDGILRIKRK